MITILLLRRDLFRVPCCCQASPLLLIMEVEPRHLFQLQLDENGGENPPKPTPKRKPTTPATSIRWK